MWALGGALKVGQGWGLGGGSGAGCMCYGEDLMCGPREGEVLLLWDPQAPAGKIKIF